MKRIQMNLHIKKIESFDLLANVTGGVFPIMWIEEVSLQTSNKSYLI